MLSTHVTDADIKPGYRTDHSMVTLTLTLAKETKSNLLWKFNNSLLKDKSFVGEINSVINCVIEEYADSLPNTREQLPFVRKCNIQFFISDQLFLDVLLMKIKSRQFRMLQRTNVRMKKGKRIRLKQYSVFGIQN